MVKIVIDGFGGDNAPVEIVKGSVDAINNLEDLHIVITGKEDVLKTEFAKYNYDEKRITILHADEVISMDESPTEAIRTKKNSSLVVAFDYAKANDDCVGLISAGSTGAVLTGGFLKLGRLKGIMRPALCPVLPTITGGKVAICDSGANMDCKSEWLEQFAVMGDAYLKVLGVKKPRVALLNVGTEDHKGDTRTKETFELLKARKGLHFVGNMEARDVMSGDYDLIVSDGFSGNVLLKSIEGTAKTILKSLKNEIMASTTAKFGALFMKKAIKGVRNTFDYHKYGGAVLLGCKKLLVKSHGSSNAESIVACINQVYTMSKGKLVEKIQKNLDKAGIGDNE